MNTFKVLVVICSIACTLGKPQYGQTSQSASSYSGGGGGSGGSSSSGGGSSGGASYGGGSSSGGGGSSGAAPSSGAPSSGGNYGSGSSSGGSGAGPSNSGAPSDGNYGSSNGGGGASNGGNSGASSGGDSGSSSGGGGGTLMTECKQVGGADGNLKFDCSGVSKDALTLRSEHILWLNSAGGKQQVYDIEVPNYNIAELIKAGFKPAKGGDSKINILLKKPEQTYEAQTDKPQTAAGQTKVQLQYQPIQPIKVHYPNDKPYQPISGPILPPPNK